MRTYYLLCNDGTKSVTVKERHKAYPLPPLPMPYREQCYYDGWDWGESAADPFPLALSLLHDATDGQDVSAYVEDFGNYVLRHGTDDKPRTLTREIVLAWMSGHAAARASLERDTETVLSHLAPEGT